MHQGSIELLMEKHPSPQAVKNEKYQIFEASKEAQIFLSQGRFIRENEEMIAPI